MDDGLAQSSVDAIVQDTQGYMWLGTQDGLQRYDGYNFVTYRHDPANPDSLADSAVTSLVVAPGGALWVGTQSFGLDRLLPGADRFAHFQHEASKPQSLANNSVQAVYVDRQAHLWVGTNQGLDCLQDDGSFRHYHVPSSYPTANSILALTEDSQGRLWVGTEHGLYYLDAKLQALMNFVPESGVQLAAAGKAFTTGTIGALLETGDRNLWIGSRQGLFALDGKGRVLKYYRHENNNLQSLGVTHVRALIQDGSGNLWVGTYAGVSRYDTSTGRFSNYQYDATDPEGLNNNVIDTIYRDRTGLIWIGTDNAGADIYNPETRAFGYYRHRQGDINSLADNVVWSIFRQTDGTLWVATQSGLTRIDATRSRYKQYVMQDRPKNRLDDANVNVVTGDPEDDIWAGTNYGLYKLQPQSGGFTHYNLIRSGESRYGNIIYSMLWDHERRLWLGTAMGLVRYDWRSGAITRYRHDPARADSLPDDSVVAACESKGGRLWVMTTNGLAYFDGNHDHFTVFHANASDSDALSDNNVQSCLAEPDGNLWVGTASGLNYLQASNGKFRHYTVSDGLPSNLIYAILPDKDGVWVSTTNGLSHFDRTNRTFRNYGKSDGLQGAEFNGGSAFASPDGELMFGGVNGLSTFYPEHLVRSELPPQVAISSFLRSGTPVLLPETEGAGQPLEVRYRQNMLSFEFAAFDYAAPALNKFMYRLDGFDQDWHRMQGRRVVTYTNLDPGKYRLQVKASNHDGIWSNGEATLDISISPPPWRTWWAYLLYAAVGFVAVMLGLKLYKRSIKREHDFANEQQRRRWAEALHHLIQTVAAQRDERAIAEMLIDTLTNFVNFECAMFYVERDMQLVLTASRGISAGELAYLEHWPTENNRVIARLRPMKKPLLLGAEEAASLETANRNATRSYLAVPLTSVSGTFRLLLVGRPTPIRDQQQVDIAAAMAKQVSVALDNAQLIKELENLATTDGLTRLYNRRHFLERAESEFERSRRYQRELSVLLLDADHFKAINDSHGHEVGDRVLRVLANSCRLSLRQLDIIGRYGGEEFVVLLPETSAALAHEAAERLRVEIEQLRIPMQTEDIRIRVSIGVATAGATTESVAALINEADRALYEAKRQGRNCVVAAVEQRRAV